VTYHLQHSTEQSKDERVNEWMLVNFKYRKYRAVTKKLQTSETTAGVLPIYDRTIVTSQSSQYDFY